MTNIKVDRLLLISALEDEQRKETEEFKHDMERFREAEKTYPERLAKSLENAAKAVRGGKIPKSTTSVYRGDDYVRIPDFKAVCPEMPTKPKQNGRACSLQRQIKLLKLSKEATITLNENSEYAQFICKL